MTIYNLPKPKSYHYLNRYYKLIDYYSKINFDGYTETHHILPKSMGGTDDKTNLIVLSARLHFIAHYLLWKSYQNQSMTAAFILMKASNKVQKRYYNSKLYEKAKKEYSKIQSIRMSGENNTFYGKSHTKETREKISIAKQKLLESDWINPHIGMTRSDETKEKIRKSKSGQRHWTNGVVSVKSIECPGEGWRIGRAPSANFKHSPERKAEIKAKMADGKMSWWNNGILNKRQRECPGDGWVRGRLKSSMSEKFLYKKKGSEDPLV